MPSISLFGRRTILGGDDLQPASYLTILVRILQIIGMIVPLLYHIINREVFVVHPPASSSLLLLLSGSSNEYNNSMTFLSSSSYTLIANSKQMQVVEVNDQLRYLHQEQVSFQTEVTTTTTVNNDEKCLYARYYFVLFLYLWLLLSLLFSIVSIWLEWVLSYWSSIGPPIEIDSIGIKIRTKKVQQLVEYKLLHVSLLLFIVWIFGIITMFYAPYYYRCGNNNSTSNSNNATGNNKTFQDVLQQWWWIIPTSTLLLTQIIEVIVSWLFLFQLYIQSPISSSSITSVDDVGASGFVTVPEIDTTNSTDNIVTSTTTMTRTGSTGNFNTSSSTIIRRRVNNGGGGSFGSDDDYDSSTGIDRITSVSLAIDNNNNNYPATVNGNANANAAGTNNHELMEQMWERRCTNLCYCLSMSTCFMFGGRSLVGKNATANRNNGTTTRTTTIGVGNTGNTTTGSGGGTAATERGIVDRTGSSGTFGDVARALADYLEGTDGGLLDIVPSDIVMGLIVLQRLQRQRIYQTRIEVLQDKERMSNSCTAFGTSTNNINNISQSSILELESKVMTTTTTTTTSTMFPSTVGTVFDMLQQQQPMTSSSTSYKENVQAHYRPLSPPLQPKERVQLYRRSNTNSTNTSNNENNNNTTELGLIYQESSRSILTATNTIDRKLLQEAARYSKYALAIYTWVLYLYVYPISGPCRLGCYSTYRCIRRNTGRIKKRRRPRRFRQQVRTPNGDDYDDGSSSSSNWAFTSNEYCCLCRCCSNYGTTTTTDDDDGDGDNNNIDTTHRQQNYREEQQEVSEMHDPAFPSTMPIPEALAFGSVRRTRSTSSGDRSPDWIGQGVPTLHNNSINTPYHHRHHHPDATCGTNNGDNVICDAHTSAILLTADIKDETDLIYLQLESSFTDNPYCILVDHEWKSVVVSIRGTFSLEDCVTDVLIDPESLEQTGIEFGFDGTDQYCHGGVLACARNVLRDLDRHKILDELLLEETSFYSDYTLRLVGHSLGAATCTLLSYMLRNKFPSIRCCNYSPPGCTFTHKMATECQEWCTSYVIDSDIVPRLTFNSIERLRDETLELIGRVKVPKIEVTRRFVNSTTVGSVLFCCYDIDVHQKEEDLNETLADILYDDTTDLPESNYKRQLERFRAIQDERKRQRGTIRSILLYPPGRIMHIVKSGEKRSCISGIAKLITCCTTNMGSQYIPVWIDNHELNEIVVSPTMGTDHFPDRIRYILEQVAHDFR